MLIIAFDFAVNALMTIHVTLTSHDLVNTLLIAKISLVERRSMYCDSI